jgi:putative transposon-encoded protein
MRKITIEDNKLQLQDDIEEIAEGIVKKIGNGAMIMSEKKHIGKKVYILTRKS